MCAAYLAHCALRPGPPPGRAPAAPESVDGAETALQWFAAARTEDGKGVTIPSQQRYVHYFERHLRARKRHAPKTYARPRRNLSPRTRRLRELSASRPRRS